MKYDFTTIQDRKKYESEKWKMMADLNNKVPAGVIPFSVADMDFPLMPEIKEAIVDYVQNTPLGYLGVTESYLDSVRGWMKKRHNWDVESEWIVPMSGVVPSFFACVKAFSAPHDGIIVLSPVYYPFFRAAEQNGRKVVSINLIEKNRNYKIDFEKLEQEAQKKENSVLLFCSPHNPVGRVWTKYELQRVADICKKNNVLVISDEIHFDLIMPGFRHHVFSEVEPDSVILTAPSKTFNIAGLQCSNMIIQNKELRERIKKEISTMSEGSCNCLGYTACKAAYRYGDEWLNQLLQVINYNKKTVEHFFEEKMPEVRTAELQGTYLQWWDFRGYKLSDEELEKILVNEAFLFPDMGYVFGPGGNGFIRVNLGCPSVKIEEALVRLEKAMRLHV